MPLLIPLRIAFVNREGFTPQVSDVGFLPAKLLETGIAMSVFRQPAGYPTKPLTWKNVRARTFFDDFYFRIHIKPTIISVSNPIVDEPINIKIWSAFDQINVLSAIMRTGAEGLELSLSEGAVFKEYEEKTLGVNVTAQAPFIVTALFVFQFQYGAGTLEFNADRATVISYHAQVPVRETLSWKTDVLRSQNGRVQRVSVRRHPRRGLAYDILGTSEAMLRDLSLTLGNKIDKPLVLPLWAEPIVLKADMIDGLEIIADVTFSEFRAGDALWLESRDKRAVELVTTDRIDRDDGAIFLKTPAVQRFAAGDYVYPCVIGYIPNGTTLSRKRVNAGRVDLSVTVQDRVPLIGHGASFELYQGLPLLDRRPIIESDAAESYSAGGERLDFGGRISLLGTEALTVVTRPRTYEYLSQADLQYWRKFLGYIRGQVREFYAPTFRPNFVVTEQPKDNATQLLIDATPDVFTFWMDQVNRKDVYVERVDGTSTIARVTAISDPDSGVITVSFDQVIRPLGGADIRSVSMLERVRLATDTVEFTHHGVDRGTINLTLEAGLIDK